MKIIGLIYALSAAVSWGLVYAIDQKILTKVSPLSLIFIDSVLALIITLPILIFDDGSIKNVLSSGRTNLLLIILGLSIAILANFFIFSAIKTLGASTASIFEIAYPFFVVLFSFLLFGQKTNWYFALGALLMFAGALIITRFG